MIFAENIRNAHKRGYDQVWAIVRSLKRPSPSLIHVPELSPSLRLFWDYRDWVKRGQWNERQFQTVYRPRFLSEMKASTEAQTKLDELRALSTEGKNIALVCFCQDPRLCHRSLVAKLLESRGIPVITH